jgi:hypothetical protein
MKDDAPTVMGLLAERSRMSEGQLYTIVVGAIVVLLLSVTGLPNAHRSDAGTTPTLAPAAPVATTTTTIAP